MLAYWAPGKISLPRLSCFEREWSNSQLYFLWCQKSLQDRCQNTTAGKKRCVDIVGISTYYFSCRILLDKEECVLQRAISVQRNRRRTRSYLTHLSAGSCLKFSPKSIVVIASNATKWNARVMHHLPQTQNWNFLVPFARFLPSFETRRAKRATPGNKLYVTSHQLPLFSQPRSEDSWSKKRKEIGR